MPRLKCTFPLTNSLLLMDGGGSPEQDRKSRGSVPSAPCQRMEQPVYGARNANLSSALLHNRAEGLRAATNAFCPPCRGGTVTACVPHPEGILAVPPPKPSQSTKCHKQTQQSVPSALRVEAVGRDSRFSYSCRNVHFTLQSTNGLVYSRFTTKFSLFLPPLSLQQLKVPERFSSWIQLNCNISHCNEKAADTWTTKRLLLLHNKVLDNWHQFYSSNF